MLQYHLIHNPSVHGSPSVFHRPHIAHALNVWGVWKVPKAKIEILVFKLLGRVIYNVWLNNYVQKRAKFDVLGQFIEFGKLTL